MQIQKYFNISCVTDKKVYYLSTCVNKRFPDSKQKIKGTSKGQTRHNKALSSTIANTSPTHRHQSHNDNTTALSKASLRHYKDIIATTDIHHVHQLSQK